MDREESLMTLGERLDNIENRLAKIEAKMDVLWADHVVDNVDLRRHDPASDINEWGVIIIN